MRPLLLLLSLLLLGRGAAWAESLSTGELEQRVAEIEAELDTLASYSLRGGVGTVGYRSNPNESETTAEWVQINLEEPAMIDQVVLVPTIWRDLQEGFSSDAFPQAFTIIVGTENGEVEVAQESDSTMFLPRLAPLIIPITPIKANWVRVKATKLTPATWDGKKVLQLSEVILFSGEENVALHQTVEAASHVPEKHRSARSREYLVDGFLPYLMDSAGGEQSKAYFSPEGIAANSSLRLDLGQMMPVNRIHILGPDLSDTVPQALLDGYGVPEGFVLEGASQRDFSDAVELARYNKGSIYDTGPILMFRFAERELRYVRLRVTAPFRENRTRQPQIGLAEIEIYSEGVNVARGVEVVPSYPTRNEKYRVASLTDGNNYYGEIIGLREWMSQLARRHDLEQEHPRVEAELHQRYERQKLQLRVLGWISLALFVGIIITVLVYRMLKERAVYETRNRIAANLHDELGANLHAIGMLGDLAKEEVESEDKEELIEIVDEIRNITRKTGDATRACTNMLESPDLYNDVIREMRLSTKRILSDIKHEFTIEGEHELRKIRRSARIDLYLFYKEALTNILRHSHATEVKAHIHATQRYLTLTISDNGDGLASGSTPPPSLQRRARLIPAKLEVISPKSDGTTIQLHYRRRLIK